MGTALIGRNVRIEVAATYGSAKTVTAITLANPGVATSAAHGLADGAVGYMNSVTGMSQIDGQAIRVNSPSTNDFQLEGIDTSTYATFTGGTFVPVSTWATLSRAANYQIGGGAGDPQDNTTLLDYIRQEVNGPLAAQTVSIDFKLETIDDAAMALLTAAARVQGYVVCRITLSDGAQRVFRGQPSLFGENVSQGSIGTGSLTIRVKGEVLRLGTVA